MRLSKAWVVAAKDLKVFTRKSNVIRYVVLFPLIVSIALPLVLRFAGRNSGGIPVSELPRLLSAFSFFFVIVSAYLPTSIASYSLLGEKLENSLEPLLATPISDRELLLGKTLAGFIPSLAAVYAGAIVYMTLSDLFTYQRLNCLYFPNWPVALIFLLVGPLTIVLSIAANVIVSSRATDVRSAQLQGVFVVLPFAGVYVASEIGFFSLNVTALFIMSAIIVVADVGLLAISTRVFQREEILTKWT